MGINTVRAFLETQVEDLCATTELGVETIRRIRKDFERLLEVRVSQVQHQSTGITSLDDFLGGGLRVGHIYEICGRIGTGKSKFCHTIALKLAQQGIGCLYVDMNGDLVPALMRKLLVDMGEPPEELQRILSLIRIDKVWNLSDLKPMLKFIASNKEALDAFGLLIMDSLAILHVVRFDKKKEKFSENVTMIRECYKLLHEIAKIGNFTVILTNLLISHEDDSKITPGSFNIGLQLNEIIPFLPFTRLRIDATDEKSSRREISVLTSNHLDMNAKVSLQLTHKGFI
ncbi:DNA repair protein RAD51 homolog 4-like [Phlebotomus argentipes]|uniref:DNA repair protein RAD51 homolog 4-like n=1 Tax=Phlebotomus argentipes TaxID=94469 RepID=UPI0028929E38|nr:DNA repair protein RAD51 homolog 4-like [Phlebotomus argentipes]